ncbi:MAG: hypothetical protein HOP07_02405 [Bacteriovoracaceae bacterium]|nr:hypothetical protein [Bacteriovoracaceae bacterium]
MSLKSLLRLPLFVLALTFFAGAAHASFLIEPHLGYNISGSGERGSGASLSKYSYSGLQIGARAGYQVLGFMAGLDFTRSSYTFETKGVASTVNNDIDKNEVGIFVGYNLPILLRAWATYYFSNTAKYSSSTTETSGNTTELGVGFTGLPFMSINLMLRLVNFDEQKTSSTTVAISPAIDLTEIVIGVSLPLTL